MNGLIKICIAGLLVVSPAVQTSAREWTLADCVNYALANNRSEEHTSELQSQR